MTLLQIKSQFHELIDKTDNPDLLMQFFEYLKKLLIRVMASYGIS